MLVFPGQKTEWLVLSDVLHACHDDARASINAEREKRRAAGVPLSDDVDIDALRGKLSAALESSTMLSLDDVRGHLDDAGKMLAGLPIDPGEFVPPENSDRVRVRCVVMTDHDLRRLRFAVMDAQRALVGGLEGGSWQDLAEKRKARDEACAAFLLLAVDAVEIDGDVLPMDMKTVAALARSDLLLPIYNAMEALQGLPAKKLQAFVSSPALTSAQGSLIVGAVA